LLVEEVLNPLRPELLIPVPLEPIPLIPILLIPLPLMPVLPNEEPMDDVLLEESVEPRVREPNIPDEVVCPQATAEHTAKGMNTKVMDLIFMIFYYSC
jgi:hypothetical protein